MEARHHPNGRSRNAGPQATLTRSFIMSTIKSSADASSAESINILIVIDTEYVKAH
jgi:hypothetical protein